MHHHKKFLVGLSLICFMLLAVAATTPPQEPHAKNLKVLPKNISHDDLDKIMDGFKASLGVKCNFCHAQSKEPGSDKLDFALDEKPEKEIARKMLRMTAKINKKYFSFNKDANGVMIPSVECMTCHRGKPHPNDK